MNKEDALKHIDQLLAPNKLSDVDKLLLGGAWDGKEYTEIVTQTPYSLAHTKHLGKKLWDLLSDRLDQPVTKGTFRHIFEQMLEPLPVIGDRPPFNVPLYGRSTELSKLSAVVDQNHLVALLGPPGIGKTALAAKLVQSSSATRWDQAVWKTLNATIQLDSLIDSLLAHLQPQSNSKQREPLALLIEQLQARRCLIVLDSAEVVRGSSEYEAFLRQVVGATHRSCILLTSEDPIEIIEHWQFSGLAAQTLLLRNLDMKSAKQILRDSGLVGEQYWQQLIDRHGGNPLVLKLIANGISELFGGQVEDVVCMVSTFFTDELEFLIGRQFRKLRTAEKRVVLVLAQADAALSFSDLLESSTLKGLSSSDLVQVLDYLGKRSIIEILKEKSEPTRYKLNSIVKKHALNTLTDEAVKSAPIGA